MSVPICGRLKIESRSHIVVIKRSRLENQVTTGEEELYFSMSLPLLVLGLGTVGASLLAIPLALSCRMRFVSYFY